VPFHLSFLRADIIYFVFITIGEMIQLWLVLTAWRRGSAIAGLFLIPFALGTLLTDMGNLGSTLEEAGIKAGSRLVSNRIELLHHPFPVSVADVANIVSLFGFLAVLVYLFGRTVREEQRLSTALQAAHEIQIRLVPASNAMHGGLKTEVTYLAAEEVGGDFCQILPREGGSVLVVIGDVGGKGLKAAMVGAIAVGALRSMTETGLTPAILLQRINETMVRGGERVFITCLCLEISPGGQMTVANAGHPAPYINGIEMVCEPCLPLGLADDIEYVQKTVTLPETARVTLLSDGVVEARSKTGELFGFERTLEISGQRAAEIAAAAMHFGQEDDITVVTLDWSAPQLAC